MTLLIYLLSASLFILLLTVIALRRRQFDLLKALQIMNESQTKCASAISDITKAMNTQNSTISTMISAQNVTTHSLVAICERIADVESVTFQRDLKTGEVQH